MVLLTLSVIGWSLLSPGGSAGLSLAGRGVIRNLSEAQPLAVTQHSFLVPARCTPGGQVATPCLPREGGTASVPGYVTPAPARRVSRHGVSRARFGAASWTMIVNAGGPLVASPSAATAHGDSDVTYAPTSRWSSRAVARRWGPCWSSAGLMDLPYNGWGEMGLTLSLGYYVIGGRFGWGWRPQSAAAGCGAR